MPVPGDGRYEWDGFHPPEDLPRSINPANGWFATANEMNLPPDYPNAERKISFEWAENSRATRITEVLGAQTGLSTSHSLTQSMALQTDDFSIPARRLAPLIATLSAPDDATKGDAARALDLLRGWDHHLGRHSAPAALSEVWWTRHLKPALLDGVTDDPVARKLLSPGDNETLLGMLERSSDPTLLIETLAAAFATCRELLGDDPAQWQWGELHHGYFPHPLSPVAKGAWRDVGPLAKGGSGSSPMAPPIARRISASPRAPPSAWWPMSATGTKAGSSTRQDSRAIRRRRTMRTSRRYGRRAIRAPALFARGSGWRSSLAHPTAGRQTCAKLRRAGDGRVPTKPCTET